MKQIVLLRLIIVILLISLVNISGNTVHAQQVTTKDLTAFPMGVKAVMADSPPNEAQEVRKTEEKDKSYYFVKLKIIPYTGPHNSVGMDNITLGLDTGSKVWLEKFEHLETHEQPAKFKASSQGLKIKQTLSSFAKLLLGY